MSRMIRRGSFHTVWNHKNKLILIIEFQLELSESESDDDFEKMETLHEVNDIVAKESNFEIQARESLQSQKELRENLCSEYKVNYYLLKQRVAWTNNFTKQISFWICSISCKLLNSGGTDKLARCKLICSKCQYTSVEIWHMTLRLNQKLSSTHLLELFSFFKQNKPMQ